MRGKRLGFTMIELLVTIGIIGLLMALLMPAIQKVREAANKMSCASNLKQIGLAIHQYHGDTKRLPPGYYGPMSGGNIPPSRGPYIGTLYCILPYIEQQSLYKAFRELQQTNPIGIIPGDVPLVLGLDKQQMAWWTRSENEQLATTKISLFLCPSDEVEPATPLVIRHSMMTLLGTGKNYGKTNYIGVLGGGESTTYKQFEGVMGNRTSLNLGLITNKDGTSNTLMMGETLGGEYPNRQTIVSWTSSPPLITEHGIGSKTEPFQGGASINRFSSMHTGGSQFVMCDASIKFVRSNGTTNGALGTYDINGPWGTLQKLAGWKDGSTITD